MEWQFGYFAGFFGSRVDLKCLPVLMEKERTRAVTNTALRIERMNVVVMGELSIPPERTEYITTASLYMSRK